jgi:hypothetical protein
MQERAATHTLPPVSLPPVFILGITRRSGTNYLADLLRLHPATTTREPIHEDHLVQRAHHLRRYVEATTNSWSEAWGVDRAAEQATLWRALGDAIVGFLTAGAGDRRVVTKTPSVENLDLYPALFPTCPLIVLVRDGRSVVESSVRSFDISYESASRDWAAAGQRILDFDARHRGSDLPYRIVRYEDLLDDPVATLTGLLTFCGLDPAAYDFDAARSLPVRGSSTVRDQGPGKVHWAPVERTETFRPKERWTDWDAYRHERFARVAGEVQRRLGYDGAAGTGAGLRGRARHVVDDAAWAARSVRRRYFLRRP